MSAKRWQIVGGYALAIIDVVLIDFVEPPHSTWSWWTVLSVTVFVASYQMGGYIVRQWQEAK